MQRFRSKIDAWLIAVALASMALIAGAPFAGVRVGQGRGGAPVVLLFVMAALVATMATTRCVVSDEWSLDRIELAPARGFWLLVSPADRAGFVRAVVAKAPHVQLDAELPRLLA